jgi:hypothetical protein
MARSARHVLWIAADVFLRIEDAHRAAKIADQGKLTLIHRFASESIDCLRLRNFA